MDASARQTSRRANVGGAVAGDGTGLSVRTAAGEPEQIYLVAVALARRTRPP